ncbi:hypothetical protein ACFOSE_09630, partial [Streptococcus dentapri]
MSTDELIDKYGLAPQAAVYEQLRGSQWQEDHKAALDTVATVVIPTVAVVSLVVSVAGMVGTFGAASPVLGPVAAGST